MNDLNDLFERLSAPGNDYLADPSTLLREGRRRVRRRRLAAVAVPGAMALGLGGVASYRLVSGTPTTVSTATTSYADLDLTPLSNAEVETRCVSALRLMGDSPPDFVVPDSIRQPNASIEPDGKEHQTPKPWHTGTLVFAMPRTEAERQYYGEPTGCTIPEAGRSPQAFSRVGTPSELRGECGDHLGIDLTDWQQLTASSDGVAAIALFRSGNGFLAYCTAEGGSPDGVQAQTSVAPDGAPATYTDRWAPQGRCWQAADTQVHCFGDGRIDDHTATQVDVTLPSGRVVRTGVVDGYWSISLADDASGQWDSKPGATFGTTPVS
jgi:hypothetical protein